MRIFFLLARIKNMLLQINPQPRLRNYRRVRDSVSFRDMMINKLISVRSSNVHYLEIGVRRGRTFERIRADRKTGVEPVPQFDSRRLPQGVQIFEGTSDAYFSPDIKRTKADVVFIDGMHTFSQSWRDFCNSSREMNIAGLIVVDDVWPQSKASALPDPAEAEHEKKREQDFQAGWQGDVWKTIFAVINIFPWLKVSIVGEPGRAIAAIWGDWEESDRFEAALQSDSLHAIDALDFSGAIVEKFLSVKTLPGEIALQYQRYCRRTGQTGSD